VEHGEFLLLLSSDCHKFSFSIISYFFLELQSVDKTHMKVSITFMGRETSNRLKMGSTKGRRANRYACTGFRSVSTYQPLTSGKLRVAKVPVGAESIIKQTHLHQSGVSSVPSKISSMPGKIANFSVCAPPNQCCKTWWCSAWLPPSFLPIPREHLILLPQRFKEPVPPHDLVPNQNCLRESE